MREKLFVRSVERWCIRLKFNIKGKDILPYMETKLMTLIENPDKPCLITWSKHAPNVISVDGFYTIFKVQTDVSKELLLKFLEV